MTLTRPVSWFLVAFAVWSWVIWPTFLKNVAADPRAWQATGGPTAFFTVHLVLTVVSLILGTVIGIIGIRGLLAARKARQAAEGTGSADPRSAERSGSHAG